MKQKFSFSSLIVTTFCLCIMSAIGMTSVAYGAPPAANLDQVRNGPPDAPVDPGDWVNGNVGGQQGHYVEGYSIPYRAVLTDLPIGDTIWLMLGYDIKHSDRHAIDYLTYYDRIDDPLHVDVFGHSQETIDPTIGVAGVSGPASSTYPIPEPSSVGGPAPGQPGISFNNLPAGERVMSIWNGTITDIQYGTQGDLSVAQSETEIIVTFVASSATAVLSWGGHIGSRLDWGFDIDGVPYSAGGISGSPYHMRLLDWNLNNLGNQDRSLSAVAVYIPPPECVIEPLTDAICEGFSASFTVIASSGMPPYTYSWTGPNSFASTDATITISNATPADAGTYIATVTDSDGKTTECQADLTVWAQPVCGITGDTEVCVGFTTEWCATPGMTSYEWSGPGGFTSDLQCVDVGAGLAPGTHTYQVIITDENGCADTCSADLTVNDQPVCSIEGDLEVCVGFTTEWCATPGMASYAWSGPGGFTSDLQCVDVGAGLAPGTHTYQVIITDDNGCADTCSADLTVNAQPVCNIEGDLETCVGFTTEWCATPGMASYAWTGPGGFTSDLQCVDVGAGLAPGTHTYQVIITDDNGCADTCSADLTVNDQPVCNIEGDLEVCVGFTTEWCATPGMASYAWTGPGGFTSDLQCVDVGAGLAPGTHTYQVIITDENGCADTCSADLTVNDQPVCNIEGDLEVCVGFTTEWCATPGMASYAWTGPSGFTSDLQCVDVGAGLAPGTHTYQVIITDDNGCADTCSADLTVNAQPVCDIEGDEAVCTGYTTEWCATPGMASYAWTGPGGFTSDLQCIDVGVGLAPGTHTYQVIITDDNGCADTCSADLTVNDQPVCNIEGDLEVCVGFTTEWCATPGMASYEWSGPGGFTSDLQCVDVGAGLAPGTHTYQVIITDASGCADTCDADLTVNAQPVCDIEGDLEVCVGFTTEWCATPGMASYEWSGPGGFMSDLQCVDVGAGLAPGTHTYQVIITDDNGCADTCSADLTVNDQPVCDIEGDLEVCVGFTTEWCATPGMASYEWSGPGGFWSDLQCVDVGASLAPGTHTYQVIITDGNGCADTCSADLTVNAQPVCNIDGDDAVCTGFTTEWCATAGMASYAWTGPGGFMSDLQCVDVGAGLAPGTHTYQVIITDDNGCADTCSADLTVNDQPVCNIEGDLETCVGFTTEWCATAGMASYEWSGPGGFMSDLQCVDVGAGLAPGTHTYQVIITDESGCADTCSADLTVNGQPVCNIEGDLEVCVGFTTEWCATAGMASYAWTGPGGFMSDLQCVDVGAGLAPGTHTYQVIITDDNGCADTCSADLTVNAQPVCNIEGDDAVCTGFTTEWCATAGMASYAWTGPGGFTSDLQCIDVGAGLASGTHTYQVIITDDNGCADTCSADLTVNDQPVCDILGDDSLCVGYTTELCATADMASYLWSGPSDFTSDQQCITVGDGMTAGTYTYEVIITDASGCADTCSIDVEILPLPSCLLAEPDPLPICGSIGNVLTATSQDADSYDWTVSGDGWMLTGGQGTPSIVYTAGNAGSPGYFKLVVMDAFGCMDSCEVTFDCEVPPDTFCTYTQGGWGTECPEPQVDDEMSTQPGCIRDHFFDDVFPDGVTIGDPGGYTAHWTTSAAVEAFLPAGSTPAVFTGPIDDDPTWTPAGVLAGQILALRLNREYSCAGIMYYLELLPDPTCYGYYEITYECGGDYFTGMTVDEFLALADQVIGGEVSALDPYSASVSDLNNTATCLNELFNNCYVDRIVSMIALKGGKVSSDELLPTEFSLSHNFPNPFNPSTDITFGLPEATHVTLDVFNVVGRKVATIVDREFDAGFHTVTWNAGGLSTGLYFYRIQASSFTETKKMLLLK